MAKKKTEKKKDPKPSPPGGRSIPRLAFLLGPPVVTLLFYLVILGSSSRMSLFAILHALTVVWVVVYIKKKLGCYFLLPLSMLLCVAGPLVCDMVRGGANFSGSMAVAIFYAIPWIVASLVVAGISRKKEKGAGNP